MQLQDSILYDHGIMMHYYTFPGRVFQNSGAIGVFGVYLELGFGIDLEIGLEGHIASQRVSGLRLQGMVGGLVRVPILPRVQWVPGFRECQEAFNIWCPGNKTFY